MRPRLRQTSQRQKEQNGITEDNPNKNWQKENTNLNNITKLKIQVIFQNQKESLNLQRNTKVQRRDSFPFYRPRKDHVKKLEGRWRHLSYTSLFSIWFHIFLFSFSPTRLVRVWKKIAAQDLQSSNVITGPNSTVSLSSSFHKKLLLFKHRFLCLNYSLKQGGFPLFGIKKTAGWKQTVYKRWMWPLKNSKNMSF